MFARGRERPAIVGSTAAALLGYALRMPKGLSRARLLWLGPALCLGAVVLGAGIVLAGPLSLFGLVLAGLALVPVGWVLVSALFPARAERRCPACGGESLARLDAHATHGLVCRACGWRDESASAWLMAEEEGPLEEIVLAERGRARAARTTSAPRAPRSMDSSRRPG